MIENSVFIQALLRKPTLRTPVWIMRQAGRYLPEYCQTRAKAGDFLTLCKTPELACEVTLQPLNRFALDAAILFSDILTIPDAMNRGLAFYEGEGPKLANPIKGPADIQKLFVPDPYQELNYVMQAIRLIRQALPTDMPLIGFAGSPWTLACYMIEGQSSKDFKKPLLWLYNDPLSMHFLLDILAQAVEVYLLAQVHSGVNALMIFDTWGGLLSSKDYLDFSLHYMQKIINTIQQKTSIPVILFTKGGGQWIQAIAATGCQAISLDWTCDLATARQAVGDRVALQGNLDPKILLTNPLCIEREVKQTLDSFGKGHGHIFNLGHGITPDVPPEHVTVMVEAIHRFSPKFHKDIA